MIRTVVPEDAAEIREIYNHYILHSTVTFEETPVSLEGIAKRIKSLSLGLPWVVCENGGEILGYAYAARWKSRSAYLRSVESTVYLRQGESNKGIGSRLYAALIKRLTTQGFHAVIGGIALPNQASIALHEKLGFEKVAHFKEVGFKFNRWIDVGYWQLIIDNQNTQ